MVIKLGIFFLSTFIFDCFSFLSSESRLTRAVDKYDARNIGKILQGNCLWKPVTEDKIRGCLTRVIHKLCAEERTGFSEVDQDKLLNTLEALAFKTTDNNVWHAYLLRLAQSANCLTLVRHLIAQEPSLVAISADDRLPLEYALQAQPFNETIVAFLNNAEAYQECIDACHPMLLLEQKSNKQITTEQFVYRLSLFRRQINTLGKNGLRPLDRAVLLNDAEAVQAILDLGADRSLKDKDGYTSLHRALNASTAVITKLLAVNPNAVESASSANNVQVPHFDIQDREGKTPLHYSIDANNRAMTDLLLQAGIDVTIKDSSGATAMHKAVAQGMVSLMRPLYARSNKILEIADDNGHTPFLMAIRTWQLLVAQELVALGTNIAAVNSQGKNALHLATELFDPHSAQYEEILSFIFGCGGDLSGCDHAGKTALHYLLDKLAGRSKLYPLGKMAEKFDLKKLDPAYGRSYFDYVKYGINTCYDRSGLLATLKNLCGSSYEDKNIPDCDTNNRAQKLAAWLWCAVDDSDLARVKFYLAHGAQSNVCNQTGKQLLYVAAESLKKSTLQGDEVAIFASLLTAGADPLLPNQDGDTTSDLIQRDQILKPLQQLFLRGISNANIALAQKAIIELHKKQEEAKEQEEAKKRNNNSSSSHGW